MTLSLQPKGHRLRGLGTPCHVVRTLRVGYGHCKHRPSSHRIWHLPCRTLFFMNRQAAGKMNHSGKSRHPPVRMQGSQLLPSGYRWLPLQTF